jgi:hypothetical protein
MSSHATLGTCITAIALLTGMTLLLMTCFRSVGFLPYVDRLQQETLGSPARWQWIVGDELHPLLLYPAHLGQHYGPQAAWHHGLQGHRKMLSCDSQLRAQQPLLQGFHWHLSSSCASNGFAPTVGS